MGRNNDRPEIISGLYICRKYIRIRVNAGIMFQKLMVYINFLIADFNNIPGNADDPFDKIFAGIFGEFKHHNISAFWICNGNQGGLYKRQFNSVDKFIDQDMVSDLEGLFHGPGGNFKCLNDKSSDEQCQYYGDNDGFNVFSESALFFLREGFIYLNGFSFFQSCEMSFFNKLQFDRFSSSIG